MTVKELINKEEGFGFIEDMREDGYEDLYQECTSILNGVSGEYLDDEVLEKLYDIKDKYETKLHMVLDSVDESNLVDYPNDIELNVRSFNRLLSKFPAKLFTLEEECYQLKNLKFRKSLLSGEDYIHEIIKTDFNGNISIDEDEYNCIAFAGDLEVIYNSRETLKLSENCEIVRNDNNGEIQVYVTTNNGKFPRIIGKCALSDNVKELFKEPKEHKEPKAEKKTTKVKSETKKISKSAVNKKIADEDLSALEDLDI